MLQDGKTKQNLLPNRAPNEVKGFQMTVVELIETLKKLTPSARVVAQRLSDDFFGDVENANSYEYEHDTGDFTETVVLLTVSDRIDDNA